MAPGGSENSDNPAGDVHEGDVLDANARERIQAAEGVKTGVRDQLAQLQGSAEKTRYLAESEKGRLELMEELEGGDFIDKIATTLNVFGSISWGTEGAFDVVSTVLLTWVDDFLTDKFGVDGLIDRDGEDEVRERPEEEEDDRGWLDRLFNSRRDQTGDDYVSRESGAEGSGNQERAQEGEWNDYPNQKAYVAAMLAQGKQPYVGRDSTVEYKADGSKKRDVHYPELDCGIPEGFGPVDDSELANPDAPYFTSVGFHGILTSAQVVRNNPHAGASGRSMHTGTDIGYPEKTPLVCNRPFMPVRVGFGNANGCYLVIKWLDENDQPVEPSVYFLHLYEIPTHLQMGKPYEAPYAIARVGSTGSSTGPHLHYQVGSGETLGSSYAQVDSSIPLKQGVELPPEYQHLDHDHEDDHPTLS